MNQDIQKESCIYRGIKNLILIFCMTVFCIICTSQTVLATENTAIESLSVSIGSQGVHPGKNNYLRIKSYIDTGYQLSDVRLRVYNKKGQYVFQKKYKNTYGGFLDFKWNGKASKKNEAGVAKTYVKKGNYTVEVAVLPPNTEIPTETKMYTIKVNKKVPTGQAGVAAAKTLPILTGDAEVDYMAEQICKAAGVKNSQSDAEKVRLIYHWMTVNQKHRHSLFEYTIEHLVYHTSDSEHHTKM